MWIRYNAAFLASLTTAEQVGVLAHEVLHPALLHPYRRGSRDLRAWNEACDFAINAQLVAAGFTLPANVLLDPQFDGLSAEQIYAKRRSTAAATEGRAENRRPEEQDEDPEDEEQPGDVNEDDDELADEETPGDEQSEGDSDEEAGQEVRGPGARVQYARFAHRRIHRRPRDLRRAVGADGEPTGK